MLNRDGGRLALDLDHAIRDHANSFEHVGITLTRPFNVAHAPGDVEPVRGTLITARSMRWLEAAPLSGRTLIPAAVFLALAADQPQISRITQN